MDRARTTSILKWHEPKYRLWIRYEMWCGVCVWSECVCGVVWFGVVWCVACVCVVWCGVVCGLTVCGVVCVVCGISLFGSKPNAIEQ